MIKDDLLLIGRKVATLTPKHTHNNYNAKISAKQCTALTLGHLSPLVFFWQV